MSLVRSVSFSRAAAHALETGRFHGLVARFLSAAVSGLAERALVRPTNVPGHVGLVCVGGATLGGSGKTRVAIAVANELALLGAEVALVGHAYRVAPRSARVVRPTDLLEDVGDEALVCARELEPKKVPVVVGPTRQAAVDHAVRLERRPDVLVLDGPIAVRGRSGTRTLSLLSVDANRPWGSGRLPPAGDLRAPRETLLARAQHVVPVDATPARVRWPSGDVAPVTALRQKTLGLFTAIARPDRLVRALAAAGVRPREIVSVQDHGPVGSARARLDRASVDAWIATPKCATHLAGLALPSPIGVLESDLRLPEEVLNSLARVTLEPSRPRGALTPSAQTP